ncbi:unnamed protein product [Onchocerca flexuosa]|uniref:DUF3668 domain-containing protein n=1 Tax=Onchocerca flexuosa TaxID=387005 RepID=A0A183HFS4_9BILA|nr:unnamed protein product [Onchocerca flexuosa]
MTLTEYKAGIVGKSFKPESILKLEINPIFAEGKLVFACARNGLAIDDDVLKLVRETSAKILGKCDEEEHEDESSSSQNFDSNDVQGMVVCDYKHKRTTKGNEINLKLEKIRTETKSEAMWKEYCSTMESEAAGNIEALEGQINKIDVKSELCKKMTKIFLVLCSKSSAECRRQRFV